MLVWMIKKYKVFWDKSEDLFITFVNPKLIKKIILDILSSVIYFAIQLVHIALHAAPVQKIVLSTSSSYIHIF